MHCSEAGIDSGPHQTRRQILDRLPFLVIYACRSDEIVIIAVSHVFVAHGVLQSESNDRRTNCTAAIPHLDPGIPNPAVVSRPVNRVALQTAM